MLENIYEARIDSLYDPEDDKTVYNYDTRKPKLTLATLNKLRMYREYKKATDDEHHKNIAIIYGYNPPENNGGL